MDVAEKRACQQFLRPQVGTDMDSTGGSTSHTVATLSLVGRVQLGRESADIKRLFLYRGPRTSNICEQLFSKTKRIMTPSRRRMGSSTLETFIIAAKS